MVKKIEKKKENKRPNFNIHGCFLNSVSNQYDEKRLNNQNVRRNDQSLPENAQLSI